MKSNQTLKTLFWHRKSKADLKDHAPIICRISIDGVYFGESDPSVSGQTGHQIDYRMMHI